MGPFPSGFGTVPVRLGTVPVGLGTVPVGLGTVPVGLATVPVRLGTDPVRLGTVPAQLGTVRVPAALAKTYPGQAIPPGPAVLTVENRGTAVHDLFIEGEGINRAAGGSAAVDVMFKPGTYPFYCPVLNRRENGEQATVTIAALLRHQPVHA